MHRTALQLLDDILEAIGNIEEDTGGISFEEFSADRRRRDAVIRNFQVIGEAIKNLPPNSGKHPRPRAAGPLLSVPTSLPHKSMNGRSAGFPAGPWVGPGAP
jgi:hypothetical protein